MNDKLWCLQQTKFKDSAIYIEGEIDIELTYLVDLLEKGNTPIYWKDKKENEIFEVGERIKPTPKNIALLKKPIEF